MPRHASFGGLATLLSERISSRSEVGSAGGIGAGGRSGKVVPTSPKEPVCESPCQACEPPIHMCGVSHNQPHHINLMCAEGSTSGTTSQADVLASDARCTYSVCWQVRADDANCPHDFGFNNNVSDNSVLERTSFLEERDVFPVVNRLDDELVGMMGRWSVAFPDLVKEGTTGSFGSVKHSSIGDTVASLAKAAEETAVGNAPMLPVSGTWWSNTLHESTESMRLSGSEGIASMMEDVSALGAQLDHLLNRQAQLLAKSDIVCGPSGSTLSKSENNDERDSLPAQPYNPLRYCMA